MSTRKCLEVPADLSRLGQRFAAWRESRVVGQRIPETLWDSAVQMAAQYGVSRSAGFLKLDYYALKKRLESASTPATSAPFLELPPLPLVSVCLVEFEDRSRGVAHACAAEGPERC